jgi:hypothetical protein
LPNNNDINSDNNLVWFGLFENVAHRHLSNRVNAIVDLPKDYHRKSVDATYSETETRSRSLSGQLQAASYSEYIRSLPEAPPSLPLVETNVLVG